MELNLENLDPVVATLRAARRMLVITGAGMSADSGLPTYRGVGGLYADKVTDEGLPIEVALSAGIFAERPEVTWKHIQDIERACRHAQPNDGHRVLAAWENRFEGVCILTQNVDGLHRAAGSSQIIDIHGDTHDLLCTRCAWSECVTDYAHLAPTTAGPASSAASTTEAPVPTAGGPASVVPRCPQCSAVIRPRVVLFDETVDPGHILRLQAELSQGVDVVFAIGTSALFPYIVAPVFEAVEAGVPTVEINPEPTDLSHLVTYKVRTGAAAALTTLDRYLNA